MAISTLDSSEIREGRAGRPGEFKPAVKKEWRRDGRENDELPRSAHAASVDVGSTDCAHIAVCHYRSSELPRDVLLRARGIWT